MTHDDVLNYVKQLPIQDRKALIMSLVSMVDAPEPPEKVYSIQEFRGVGAHARDEDAQDYVNRPLE